MIEFAFIALHHCWAAKGDEQVVGDVLEPTPSKVLKIVHTRFLFMVIIVDVRVCVSSIDKNRVSSSFPPKEFWGINQKS